VSDRHGRDTRDVASREDGQVAALAFFSRLALKVEDRGQNIFCKVLDELIQRLKLLLASRAT
jgi:hypothetical protein